MRQSGIALVTGLLLLAACSVLAITAAGGMTLQQQQSANFADRALAESNALLAESWARAWLYSQDHFERQTDCLAPCFLPPAIHAPGALPPRPELQGPEWWAIHGNLAASNPVSGVVIPGYPAGGEARWTAQEIHAREIPAEDSLNPTMTVAYYRVISRGTGRRPESVVVTEALLARPWVEWAIPLEFPPLTPLDRFCQQFAQLHVCGTLAWRQIR